MSFLLCGTTVQIGSDTDFLAEITGVSGLGANRRAVENVHGGNVAAGWVEYLFSCIARLKPFQVQLVHNATRDWVTKIKAPAEAIVITWPLVGTQTVAGTLTFQGALTDYDAGGQIEERVNATAEITPSGAPTLAPPTT